MSSVARHRTRQTKEGGGATDMGGSDGATSGATAADPSVVRMTVWNVHLNIVLYAMAYWIQASVLPYVSKQLGASTVTFGYLQTFFSLVQLIGGPLYGRFGDMFGGKWALLAAFAASAVSYFMLGFAWSVTILFVSRLPSMLQHSMQGGQMVITHVAQGNERTAALGRLSLSYGVGMVTGPLIGGKVAVMWGEQSAALVAGLISMVSVFLVTLLPDTTPAQAESAQSGGGRPAEERKLFDLKAMLRMVWVYEGVPTLFLVKFCLAFPFGMFNAILAVILMEAFNVTAEHNSYLMSYVAVVSIFANGLALPYLLNTYKEHTVLTACGGGLLAAFGCLTLAHSLEMIVLAVGPIVGFGSMVGVLLTGRLTVAVPLSVTGTILGYDMAVNSAVRTLTPTVGTALLSYFGVAYGTTILGIFGTVCCTALVGCIIYALPSTPGVDPGSKKGPNSPEDE